MKLDQQRYCMDRAKEIMVLQKAEEKKKHTKVTKGVTDNRKITMIRTGYADLKSKGWSAKTPIVDCFTYDDEQETLDQQAYEKSCRTITKQYRKVTDQIMLGDTQTAIKLLEEFDNRSL